MTTWWLSFADDDGCRGIVLVDAHTAAAALLAVSLAGVNPGGEVGMMEFDAAVLAEAPGAFAAALSRAPRLKLLTIAEANAIGLDAGKAPPGFWDGADEW